MSSETRIWHRAAAGLAIAALVSACGLSATPAPTLAPTPTAVPTPTAGLFVDAGSDQGPISPLVYGTNIGPTIWPPIELQPQVQAARLTTLTYPGGNWGDQYDIQTFQVDQFIAYCRTLGAEPRIVVRLKDSTPAKAAELVKYANVTKGYGVKYWGIGNEPDLYVANGMTDYTVDQYDVDWR
ncbi:MAG: hypothetical protein ACXWM8_05690, partial [Candidatus Limnocylindrales bacterium]